MDILRMEEFLFAEAPLVQVLSSGLHRLYQTLQECSEFKI
jgi:hypothetical protein